MTTNDQEYPADKLTACPICGDKRFPATSLCPGCGADKTTLTEKDIETGGQPVTGAKLPSSGELLENWYEASPYGEHVPKELPKFIAAFLAERDVQIDEQEAWEIISESSPGDAWMGLFESIFAEGAKYAMLELEDRDLLRENDQVEAAPPELP